MYSVAASQFTTCSLMMTLDNPRPDCSYQISIFSHMVINPNMTKKKHILLLNQRFFQFIAFLGSLHHFDAKTLSYNEVPVKLHQFSVVGFTYFFVQEFELKLN